MPSATEAFTLKTQDNGVAPIWIVELSGLYRFLSTVDPLHTQPWRFGDGLIFGAGAEFGSNRPNPDVRLEGNGRGLSTIRHELTDSDNTARLAGTQVEILNQDGYIDALESEGLQNASVRILFGFEGLDYPDYLLLMTGRVENYDITWDTLSLDVTDARYINHRDLSERLGSPAFPGTPADNRGSAIPMLIGRQTGIEAIQIGGDASGTLAFGINTAATSVYLNEYEANFPESGDITIDNDETFVPYGGRRYTIIQGVTYLELFDLVRAAPLVQDVDDPVTLVSVAYRYLVGYAMAAVTAVYIDGVEQLTSAYTVELEASGADYPVTTITFPTQPSGVVTVDAEAVDPATIPTLTNGDFETGDLTGWTAGAATATVTAPGNNSDYKVEVEGSEDVYDDLYTTINTVIGEVYSLVLNYRDTIPSAGLLTNGFFTTGDTTGYTLVDDATYFGAVVTVEAIAPNLANAIVFRKGPGPYGAGYASPELNEFRYEFYQDVTTVSGVNYQLSFQALADAHIAFPYHESKSPGYKIGTVADDDLYDSGQLGGSPNQGWETIVSNFTPTGTTTRVTWTVLSQSSNEAQHAAFANMVLIQVDTPETSQGKIQIGTDLEPDANLDQELAISYGWTPLELSFQATSMSTRISLFSKWVGSATPTEFDDVRLLSGGLHPINAMAKVIDDFLPTWERDEASFTTAKAQLPGWEFAGSIADPGQSEDLLNAMAYECNCVIIEGADGKLRVSVLDDLASPVLTLTTDDIVENSLRITRDSGDLLYTDFVLTFGAEGNSTAFANPDDSTHPEFDLSALCSAAANTYKVRRKLDIDLRFITDVTTANHLLLVLVERHTVRRAKAQLKTYFRASDLDVGQLITVEHPRLNAGANMLARVIRHELGSEGTDLTLRILRDTADVIDLLPAAEVAAPVDLTLGMTHLFQPQDATNPVSNTAPAGTIQSPLTLTLLGSTNPNLVQTGKFGNAHWITSSHGSRLGGTADHPIPSGSEQTFTISAWVRFLDLGGAGGFYDQLIMCMGSFSGPATDSAIRFGAHGAGNDNAFIYVTQTDASAIHAEASSFGALAIDTWYHIMAWLDPVAGELGISVNGVEDTIAHDGTIRVPSSGNNTFFGRGVTFNNGHLLGYLDQVVIWNRVLPLNERVALYNGGLGVADPTV